jgi:hypothetical protein
MRRVRVTAVVVVACGGAHQESSPRPPIANHVPAPEPAAAAAPVAIGADQMIAHMRELASRICACRDAACAQKLAYDDNKWAQEVGDQGDNLFTQLQEKQFAAITEKLTACMVKATSPPSPTLPPTTP